MSEWPKTVVGEQVHGDCDCLYCEDASARPGVEVIPADLGRELYEALLLALEGSDSEKIDLAVERYYREVGE